MGGAFTGRPKMLLRNAVNGTRTTVHSAVVGTGARRDTVRP
jgi:hypothetical protein